MASGQTHLGLEPERNTEMPMHEQWRLLVGNRVRATYQGNVYEGVLGVPRWPIRLDDGVTTVQIEGDPRWVLTPLEAPKPSKAKRRAPRD